jgi:hypothetical protein
MATHPFVHRRWVEVTGRFTGGMFDGDYADLWLHEIATALNRAVYLPTLLIEHRHHAFGKGDYDATYRDKEARMRRQDTDRVWQATLPDRLTDILKLLAVMDKVESV